MNLVPLGSKALWQFFTQLAWSNPGLFPPYQVSSASLALPQNALRPVAFSGSLLGGSSEETFVHTRARTFGTIVKSAKPTIQWKYAIPTVVAFKVFVMEEMEEISRLHAHTFYH